MAKILADAHDDQGNKNGIVIHLTDDEAALIADILGTCRGGVETVGGVFKITKWPSIGDGVFSELRRNGYTFKHWYPFIGEIVYKEPSRVKREGHDPCEIAISQTLEV